MSRLLLAFFVTAASAAGIALPSRPVAAAPVLPGAVESTEPALIQKAHSARWYYIRSHYRPYRPYYRPVHYYRPAYYRPVYYGRPYWHRRRHHGWYRPFWHHRHHWHHRHYYRW